MSHGVSFPEIMTLICHLLIRDEAQEREIIRKNEGPELIAALIEYREYQLGLSLNKDKRRFPMFGDKPGFLHVLRDYVSPEGNWSNIWKDPAIAEWMRKTKGVWEIEKKIYGPEGWMTNET